MRRQAEKPCKRRRRYSRPNPGGGDNGLIRTARSHLGSRMGPQRTLL